MSRASSAEAPGWKRVPGTVAPTPALGESRSTLGVSPLQKAPGSPGAQLGGSGLVTHREGGERFSFFLRSWKVLVFLEGGLSQADRTPKHTYTLRTQECLEVQKGLGGVSEPSRPLQRLIEAGRLAGPAWGRAPPTPILYPQESQPGCDGESGVPAWQTHPGLSDFCCCCRAPQITGAWAPGNSADTPGVCVCVCVSFFMGGIPTFCLSFPIPSRGGKGGGSQAGGRCSGEWWTLNSVGSPLTC